MQIFLYIITTCFIIQKPVSSYYELVEELSCHDNLFRLSCLPHRGQIVILEASFSNDDTLLEPLTSSCSTPGVPSNATANGFKNFRHAVNKRCSGRNICSFSLLEDHSDAKTWGPGTVYLRYACMDDSLILRSCRTEIDIAGEGFVQTPGYPNYYVGGRTCQWTLRTSPNRQVQLQLLDVSLRGIGPLEEKCKDWLLVTENGLDILETCGELPNPGVITSSGDELNVTLITSSTNLFPKRGLLFHYKAVGCNIPQPPRDGYIVTKNNTLVHYRCSYAYIFPDTALRDRIIDCHDLHVHLPNCTYVGENKSDVADDFKVNLTSTYFVTTNIATEYDADMSDIIIPSVIISFLIIGNIFIIGFIYFMKRKQAMRLDPWNSEASRMRRDENTFGCQLVIPTECGHC